MRGRCPHRALAARLNIGSLMNGNIDVRIGEPVPGAGIPTTINRTIFACERRDACQ
jgi:hypothetical protein